jgi:hypothetical protein
MFGFLQILECLKGQCHEIYDPWFFHQSIPLGPLIHGLKPFQIQIRIRGDIRFLVLIIQKKFFFLQTMLT